jgi:hypothetical protein
MHFTDNSIIFQPAKTDILRGELVEKYESSDTKEPLAQAFIRDRVCVSSFPGKVDLFKTRQDCTHVERTLLAGSKPHYSFFLYNFFFPRSFERKHQLS